MGSFPGGNPPKPWGVAKKNRKRNRIREKKKRKRKINGRGLSCGLKQGQINHTPRKKVCPEKKRTGYTVTGGVGPSGAFYPHAGWALTIKNGRSNSPSKKRGKVQTAVVEAGRCARRRGGGGSNFFAKLKTANRGPNQHGRWWGCSSEKKGASKVSSSLGGYPRKKGKNSAEKNQESLLAFFLTDSRGGQFVRVDLAGMKGEGGSISGRENEAGGVKQKRRDGAGDAKKKQQKTSEKKSCCREKRQRTAGLVGQENLLRGNKTTKGRHGKENWGNRIKKSLERKS